MAAILLTIILVTMAFIRIGGEPTCHFYKDKLFLDCSNRYLRSVPRDEFRGDLRNIDLRWNDIQTIQNQTFLKTPQLEILNLSHNNLTTLEGSAFYGLHRLLYLDLSNNVLDVFSSTILTPQLFQPLTMLEEIRIVKNQDYIGYDIDRAFNKLKNLRSLTLDFPDSFEFGVGFQALSELKSVSSFGQGRFTVGCWILYLTNKTFENLRNTSLSHIHLVKCGIELIETGAFDHLTSLKVLDLSYNIKLGLRPALQSLHGLRGQNMTEIKLVMLNGDFPNKDFVFVADDFIYLRSICVQSLDFSHNYISFSSKLRFPMSLELYCLESLNMSFHTLDQVPLYFLTTLRDSRNLKNIDFSHSYVTSAGLPSHIKEGFLPPNLLVFNVSWVDWFTSNGHEIVEFAPRSNLQFLSMAYNFQNCDFEFKSVPENLTHLDISGTACDNIELRGSESHFHLLHYLEEIDISSSKLFDIHPEVFRSNRRLRRIGLANNIFQRLPRAILGISELDRLDLSSNAFTHFRKEETELIDSWKAKSKSFLLLMKDNPLQCTCDTVRFIRWIFQRKDILDSPENYMCLQSNGTWVSLSDFGEQLVDFEVKCVSHTYLIISVVGVMTSLLLAMLFTAMYRYRLNLRYWLYTKLMPPENMFVDQVYVYDAFVAYTSDEYQWVIRQLRPKLELEDDPVSLCVHDRDFIPGKPIHENIVDKMKQGRKIMLIISADFLESRFGPLEIEYAGMKCLEEGRDDVIICVLMEDIPVGQMPRALRNLWHKITFLKWSIDPEAQIIFWRNLKVAVSQQHP